MITNKTLSGLLVALCMALNATTSAQNPTNPPKLVPTKTIALTRFERPSDTLLLIPAGDTAYAFAAQQSAQGMMWHVIYRDNVGYIPADMEYYPMGNERPDDFENMSAQIAASLRKKALYQSGHLVYKKPSLEFNAPSATSQARTPSKRASGNSGTNHSSVQCSGTTKAGNRCRRMTTSSNGRCYQH